MNKFLTLVLALLSSTFMFCQVPLGEFNAEMKSGNNSESISLVDNEKNICFIFFDKGAMTVVRLNKAADPLFNKRYPLPTKLPVRLGYNVDEDNAIHIFFSNENSNKIYCVTIEENGNLRSKPIDISFKKEKIFRFFSDHNMFHILTYSRGKSALNRYTFRGNSYEKYTYDLTKERFYNHENGLSSIAVILNNYDNQVIDPLSQNSLAFASEYVKIYPEANELLISLDHRDSATRLLSLSLVDSSYSIDHFNIPTIQFGNTEFLKSNSFIYEDRIFQIIGSYELLNISIKDISTKELIKEYSVIKDKEIEFKNSPLIKESTLSTVTDLEYDNTKQFLRRITNSGNIGIVAFEEGGMLNMHFGSTVEATSGGAVVPMAAAAGMAGMGGIPVGTFGNYNRSITLNPTFRAFSSYSYTKTAHVKCLLDRSTLEHLEGESGVSIFDEIQKFTDSLTKPLFMTVLKYDQDYIQGYYDKKGKKYNINKFSR